jgi:hypothetical protein
VPPEADGILARCRSTDTTTTPLVPGRASPHPRRITDLLAVLDGAVAALEAPLGRADTEQGWTDALRRETQEEISVSRSALRRHGPGTVRHLRPRLDEWMARGAYGRGVCATRCRRRSG